MGQVIKQLGMARGVTPRAKIIHAAHQSFSKKLLPETVHRHTGCERVARIGDPVGELQAAALPDGDFRLRSPHRHTHETAGHGIAQRIRIATDGQAHVGGFRHVLHRDGLWFARMKILTMREAEFERGDFLLQFLEALFTYLIRFVAKRLRLGLKLLFFLSPIRQLLLVRTGDFPVLLQLRQRRALDVAPDAVARFESGLCAAEHASQRIVILLADGVEFVVVAAHAAQRHSKKGGAHLTHLAVDEVVLHLELIDGVDVHIAQHDKAGRDEVFPTLLRRGGRQQVTRELLTDKAVEGFVPAEGLHKVVAIPPRMLGKDFALRADLLGIAHEVQPMPCPALSVGLGCQQTVHHTLVRLWGVVRNKFGDLRLRRGQACEVKGHAPQPGMRPGLRSWLETRRLLLCENEGVDLIQRPSLVPHGGWCGIPHRLIGPMLPAFLHIHAVFLHPFSFRYRLAGIGRTALHPFFQHGDFALRKFRLGRHLHVRVRVAHRLDEAAFFRRPRHQRGTAVATRLPARAGVQHQPTLDLLRVRMAFEASLPQNGFHALAEKCFSLRGRGSEWEKKQGEERGDAEAHRLNPNVRQDSLNL